MGNGKIDKRKIKQINGWKVNHPFSAANMFFAIFTLALIAYPVAILFIPLVTFSDVGLQITGIDLFKYYVIDFVKMIIGKGEFVPVFPDSLLHLWSLLSTDGCFLKGTIIMDSTQSVIVGDYISLGQAGIIVLLMLNSFIALIFFIILICKGYLRHARGVKTLMVFDFLLTIVFSLSFLAYLFSFMVIGAAPSYMPWFSFIPLGGALVLLIIISSIHSHNFKECVYEADLEYHEDEEKEVVTHVTEVHEVTKVNYEPSKTLPPNITSIGGHAFAENQNLEVANIPLGIDKLGNGAFANCLNLKVVSLPDSIKEIGFNCFFNCTQLERINFAGTKEQWRHVKRGSNWLAQAKTTEVVCVDGAIVVNPYH